MIVLTMILNLEENQQEILSAIGYKFILIYSPKVFNHNFAISMYFIHGYGINKSRVILR